MGVTHNPSSEEVVNQSRKYYAGPLNVNVIAVNPTKSELENILNIKEGSIKKEPSYEGNLTFYLKSPKVDEFFSVIFWISDKHRHNNSGDKAEFINNSAQTAWGSDLESINYEWFDKNTATAAYEGESNLMGFISAWANVRAKDDCYFETRNQIFKGGSVNEIRQLITSLKNNLVQVFTYIGQSQDGEKMYQNVFTGKFGRPYSNSTDFWAKSFASYAPNGLYHSDLSFGELNPFVAAPDLDKSFDFSDMPSKQAEVADNSEDDDLPWNDADLF